MRQYRDCLLILVVAAFCVRRFDLMGLSPDSPEDESGIKRAAENSESYGFEIKKKKRTVASNKSRFIITTTYFEDMCFCFIHSD